MASLPQINIRVHALRGLSISSSATRKVPRTSEVIISSESSLLSDSPFSTPTGVEFSSVSSGQEVSIKSGLLQWNLSTHSLQKIKSQQPKVKILIRAKAKDDETPEAIFHIGYILVDLRDLSGDSKWLKINGVNYAEALVSAKLNMVYEKKEPTSASASMERIQSVDNWREESDQENLNEIKARVDTASNDNENEPQRMATIDTESCALPMKSVSFASNIQSEEGEDNYEDIEDAKIPHNLGDNNHDRRESASVNSLSKVMSKEDNGDDYDSKHLYRLTIEVRSVIGLKRAANFAVQFSYPFLGSVNPVRNHPKWITANVETRLDGACASYEFCKYPGELRKIFLKNMFKVSAFSRSTLGDEELGYIPVDLSFLQTTNPHSYRCPLTKRSFGKLDDYSRFRQTIIALQAVGGAHDVPPKIPIVVFTQDSYSSIINQSSSGIVSASGAKMRLFFVLEDMGVVGQQNGVTVKLGYKMHGGGIYENNTRTDFPLSAGFEEHPENPSYQNADIIDEAETDYAHIALSDERNSDNPLFRTSLTEAERNHLTQLTNEWDAWRKVTEAQWKDGLREREVQLRRKLEKDVNAILSERADGLKRAHDEAARLELRLRTAIEAVERQKTQLTLKEEQVSIRLAQKTAELQLLQRRVRDEAKVKVEAESRKTASLTSQLGDVQSSLERAERRVKEVEKDYETYRHQMRGLPETTLREEAARLRAQLGESRGEVERERRLRADAELEKEHFRAQMHRLALALKRERERSSSMARQELEQLRLEFLAREERYVLDGDREELRTIRQELAMLRNTGRLDCAHDQFYSSKNENNSFLVDENNSSSPNFPPSNILKFTPFTENFSSC